MVDSPLHIASLSGVPAAALIDPPSDLWALEAAHRANNLLQLSRAALVLQQRQGRSARDLAPTQARLEGLYRDLSGGTGCVSGPLREVSDALVALFGPPAGGVTLTFSVVPFTLPSKSRRALVLIASELIINALRHAFSGRGGTIEVCLDRDGADWALIVADDGVGLNDSEQAGIGTGVVACLAQLLDGHMRVVSRPGAGTRAELRFPGEPCLLVSRPGDRPKNFEPANPGDAQ